jgi:hypothetical protein
MPQSWSMGQILSLPSEEGMRRIFQMPEKSNDFGPV